MLADKACAEAGMNIDLSQKDEKLEGYREEDLSSCSIFILCFEANALKAKRERGYFEDDSVLDREVRTCYGRLRSAWERAAGEVLLGGVIERMNPPVHTQLLNAQESYRYRKQ